MSAACSRSRTEDTGDDPSAAAAGSGALPAAQQPASSQSPTSSVSSPQSPTAPADYCEGHGPPAGIALPKATGAGRCGSNVAQQVFQHGLCSCSDAVFTGAFSIDGMDSSTRGSRVSASVGVNDELQTTGLLDIGGTLVVAGKGLSPITSAGFSIDGNFETNSELAVTGANIRFGRDLWVNGAIRALGFSSVERDVYQPAGFPMSGMTIGGRLFQRDFTVPEPCACGEGEVLDVEAIVEAKAGKTRPSSLTQLGVGGTLDLGCGEFTFGDSALVGLTTIKAHGRTALYIDGDLSLTGKIDIDVGALGELDIFVSGNLLVTGIGEIGSRERPAALRIYVGGFGDIALTGAQVFAANLYAPRSRVAVTGVEDLYGSFFVGAYHATGSQRMHYDAAIQRSGSAGAICDTPPETCKVDLDCASPRVCAAGGCRPLGPE